MTSTEAQWREAGDAAGTAPNKAFLSALVYGQAPEDGNYVADFKQKRAFTISLSESSMPTLLSEWMSTRTCAAETAANVTWLVFAPG